MPESKKYVLLQSITSVGDRGDVVDWAEKKLPEDRLQVFLGRGVLRPAEEFEAKLEHVTMADADIRNVSLDMLLLRRDQEIIRLKTQIACLETELSSLKAQAVREEINPLKHPAVIQVLKSKDEVIRQLERKAS